MAISYVGGKTLGTAGQGGGSVTLTTGLTGGSGGAPLANDFIVVATSVGTAARAPTLDIVTPSGYTPLTVQRTTASTYDSNVCACHKVMGSTPDTAVTIPASGNNADGIAYTIQVFRGVDPTNPMDVAAVYATATGTSNLPNAAAITPATAGAWINVVGGGAASAGGTYAAGGLTNFLTSNGPDTNDANVGAGYYTGWTSGAYDPAAWTGGSANAANSWAAITMALRPAPDPVDATGTGSLPSSSLTAPDSTATGGANVSGSFSAITATAPTATATGSAEATGSLSVLALTAPTGEATSVVIVNASASGDLASVTLTASNAAATGGATATGSLAAVTQTAPTATATGTATAAAACAAIALTAPTSTATGTAAASGALQGISLTAPTGTASGASVVNGNASGSLASISLTAATAQAVADAQAVAVFASLQINPATGAAYGTANASGVMAGISITAMTATARGTDPSVPEPGALVYRPGRQNNGKRPAQTGGTRYATGNTTRPARVARVNR